MPKLRQYCMPLTFLIRYRLTHPAKFLDLLLIGKILNEAQNHKAIKKIPHTKYHTHTSFFFFLFFHLMFSELVLMPSRPSRSQAEPRHWPQPPSAFCCAGLCGTALPQAPPTAPEGMAVSSQGILKNQLIDSPFPSGKHNH